MLNLKNISKTYVTKSKTETQALKNIDLDIASAGMVFILGKSGSGKSTLLNLLGGLDSPTDGEIFVDGASMKNFSKRDYDTYRNNYVGFVFQEFNLLADFNVRDNVALALALSKSENAEKVREALNQVELGENFLNRRIDEMSGGEKQRVAIARAIVKNSKIILADEPTGNLDSATGESIWKILKDLSRERLVVVVSHDRESAEKYADRVIEISDGRIVADSAPVSVREPSQQKPFVAAKQRLSFAARLKMGYNNLKLRKAKTVGVVLLAIFSILSVLIMQMCLSFSSELTLAKYITQYDVDYFTVSQGYIDGYDKTFQYNTVLRNSTMQYVTENSNCIRNGRIQSKQDILDMGLTFVGEALELTDNSYYATMQAIEDCYIYGGEVEIAGELVDIVKERHPPEFLVGKNVYLDKVFERSEECVLAGIIDTQKLVNPSALPLYFYNENFQGAWIDTRTTFNNSYPKEVTMCLSDKKYDGKIKVTDFVNHFLFPDTSVILTADGIISDYNTSIFELADNEIVMTYEMFSRIFDVNSKWYYISTDLTEARQIPDQIGKTFNLSFGEYGSDELFADYGEVKLVGVAFALDYFAEQSIADEFAVSEKLARKIGFDMGFPKILIQTASVKNLNSFLTTLRKDYQGYVENAGEYKYTVIKDQNYGEGTNDIANMTYDFEAIIRLISIVFLAVAVILLIVLVLLVINLISISIANRKREVGILSALGASNKDITSVFLLETLIISAISFVIIIALIFLFEWAFNKILSANQMLNIVFPFLRVDIVTVAVAVAASFGLLILAALIPARKIIKLKPIDAIRNV